MHQSRYRARGPLRLDGNAAEGATDLRNDALLASDTPFDRDRRYLFKPATGATPARLSRLIERIDISTLAREPSPGVFVGNDIARIELKTAASIAYDPYVENRSTGGFILIDEASNEAAAAGMIEA